MGTGYTRADVSNNIADGNIINASDIDSEYDAIEAAFNSSTGHTHDGTSAEGGPITVLGPAQDFVASATEIKPKTTNTLDIGTSGLQFKDLYLDGTAYLDDVQAVGAVDITGDLDVDNININGNTISSTNTNGNITLAPNGTGVVALSSTDLTFGDNDKAVFGAGSDLQIYHDGFNSYIKDAGAGYLILGGQDTGVAIQNTASQNLLLTSANDITLSYQNSPKLATKSTGVDVTGTVTADGLTVEGIAKVNEANPRIRLLESDTTDLNTQLQTQAGVFKISTVNDAETAATQRFTIGNSTGNVSFYDSTGVTQGFYWDASTQRLGLGTTSPVSLVDGRLSGTSSGEILSVGNTGSGVFGGIAISDGGTYPVRHWGSSLEFYTGNSVYSSATERMRIDSSGNVLVGTTNANPAENNVAGIGALANNTLSITRDGNAAIQLNRKTSDGSIAIFRKDGTAVGSISAWSSSLLVGTGDVGLAFVDGTPERIQPRKADDQLSADGLIDLGHTSNRFKDLYLSGGVYLGGTAAANYLDDYEEGTWTPTGSTNSGTAATFGSVVGTYVKIGNLVTVSGEVRDVDTTGTTPTSQLRISGLPFSAASSEYTGAASTNTVAFQGGRTSLTTIVSTTLSELNLYSTGDGLGRTSVDHGDITSGTSDLFFTIQYKTS